MIYEVNENDFRYCYLFDFAGHLFVRIPLARLAPVINYAIDELLCMNPLIATIIGHIEHPQ